jgi:hypothetical protein
VQDAATAEDRDQEKEGDQKKDEERDVGGMQGTSGSTGVSGGGKQATQGGRWVGRKGGHVVFSNFHNM